MKKPAGSNAKRQSKTSETLSKHKPKIKYRSASNYLYTANDVYKEHSLKPSKTQPDQTMSIRTLYEKHRRGMPLPETPVYYDTQTGIDALMYNTMDQQERVELLRKTRATVERMRSEAQAHKAEEDKKAYEAQQEALIQSRVQEALKNTTQPPI